MAKSKKKVSSDPQATENESGGEAPKESSPRTVPVSRERLSTNHINRVVQVNKLAADSTRIMVLDILRSGATTVTDLCSEIGQSQPAISHHLALLRVSGIVEGKRTGKHIHYSMTSLGRTILNACDKIAAETR